MARKDARRRTKTESDVASSSVSASASSVKRKFPLARLRRSKSAPADDGGTRSVRSDSYDAPPSSPGSSPSFLGSSSPGAGRGGGGGSGGSVAADDGAPSPSALVDLKRALEMIEDERHLAAHALYVDAKRRIDEAREARNARIREEVEEGRERWKRKRNRVRWKTPERAGEDVENREEEEARRFLGERRDEFEALENRAELFAGAKENLSVDDDWIHAQTLFGVSTSYRREADGSLSVKIEGELHDVPLFEQLVVLRECDLYSLWAPFVSRSKKLAQLDKLDVVSWYIVGVPMLGLTRDACYRAVGCDCMRENGRILLVAAGLNDTEEHGVKSGPDGNSAKRGEAGRSGRSVLKQQPSTASSDSNLVDTRRNTFLARDAILSTLEIPPIPRGVGKGRMTLRNFAASVDILGPTSARTKMVVNVDPNLQLIPQFMIDFCMKRMAGILLSRLQATARKVVKDPIKNPHARRMREDVGFYRDWLLPKFRSHCDELGWEMQRVGAFEIEEDDLRAEGTGWIEDSAENDTRVTNDGQYAMTDDAVSYAGTRLSDSSNPSRPTLGKLKLPVRRTKSQEEKIAEGRVRIANMLQPAPFSESKAHRLNELKLAKLRAEERLRTNDLEGGSCADSVSSRSTLQSVQDADYECEVKRCARILKVCLVVHAALFWLSRRSLSNVDEQRRPAVYELLDLVMVVLQAVALWALLSSVLIYSFDEIDFGQKRLVANMNFGKRLFVKEVKKLSRIAAVSVAVVSFGYGLAAGSVQKLCFLADVEVPSTYSRWWESLPGVDMQKLSSKLNISVDTVNTLEKAISNSIDIAMTIYRHVGATLSFAISKLSPHVPGALTKIITPLSVASKKITLFASSAHSRVCELDVRWGSRALAVSSFVTLRLGVFVVALVLMGHVLLPKPEKKGRRKRPAKIGQK